MKSTTQNNIIIVKKWTIDRITGRVAVTQSTPQEVIITVCYMLTDFKSVKWAYQA